MLFSDQPDNWAIFESVSLIPGVIKTSCKGNRWMGKHVENVSINSIKSKTDIYIYIYTISYSTKVDSTKAFYIVRCAPVIFTSGVTDRHKAKSLAGTVSGRVQPKPWVTINMLFFACTSSSTWKTVHELCLLANRLTACLWALAHSLPNSLFLKDKWSEDNN